MTGALHKMLRQQEYSVRVDRAIAAAAPAYTVEPSNDGATQTFRVNFIHPVTP